MSDYERRALNQIHDWKSEKPTWFERVSDAVTWPISRAVTFVNDAAGLDKVLAKSVGGLITLLNDAAHWSVRPGTIYEEFRRRGHSVSGRSDILALDLEEVDKTIGWLDAKYKGIAAAEGTLTGVAGLPGIPADIASLVGMNMRAVGEYATYCGFDVGNQEERLFGLSVLSFASSPTDAGKLAALSQLVRIAADVARKIPWKQLEKELLVKAIQTISRSLGVRHTKAKLAQILPVIGGAIGAGFNAYYTSKVCEAAYYLYRERFLAEKYGADAIEMTVRPAELAESLLSIPSDVEDEVNQVITYGSQHHLRRLVNDRPTVAMELISSAYVQAGAKRPTQFTWISPLKAEAYRELEGMEHFKDSSDSGPISKWSDFWPQTGTPPTWDAWAEVDGPDGREVLLVEAKANAPELVSPGSGAIEANLNVIKAALDRTKSFLGVAEGVPWHESYYQYCNRLACLYFLNEIAHVPARLLFVYFTGDRFPDCRICPASEEQWKPHIEKMYSKIGLPQNHALKSRTLSIFPSTT